MNFVANAGQNIPPEADMDITYRVFDTIRVYLLYIRSTIQ